MTFFSEHLVSFNVFAPLVFAAAVALLPSAEKAQIRAVALVGSLASAGLAVGLYLGLDNAGPEFQFEEYAAWIPSVGIGYHVGVDGLAASLILLTGFLAPIVVLSTFKAVDDGVKGFAIALLVLQSAMVGTFAAIDLALFFVFWEAMLIPMVLLIGIWGSQNRVYAAIKFFLFTFAGSAFLFVAILYLWTLSGDLSGGERTFDFARIYNGLAARPIDLEKQKLLFLAFAVAFAVKVPLFPLHTWLPDAHVEAPAAGSVILAGVLLKMGTFGFMRYAVPMFPDAAAHFRPLVASLAVVGIVYGALMCLAQRDMKRLVAYSSVSHLGFCMLGLFALSLEAVTGSVYQMLNHGVSTGALFVLVGILYERTHTRLIADYGGIARVTPAIAATFFVILLSSMGLPGTNGFIGEFLILTGTFNGPREAARAAGAVGRISPALFATIAGTGVVLGAVYLLSLYQRVMLGPLRHPEHRGMPDLTPREWTTVLPLCLAVIAMGVVPQPLLERIRPAAERYVQRATAPQGGAPPMATRLGPAAVGSASAAGGHPPVPPGVFRPALFPQRGLQRIVPLVPGTSPPAAPGP